MINQRNKIRYDHRDDSMGKSLGAGNKGPRLWHLSKTTLGLLFMMSILLTMTISVSASDLVDLNVSGNPLVYTNTGITIYVDGEEVIYDAMFPVVLDSRTLVPVREVVEHPGIGAKVTWISNEQKLEISKGETIIELWVNSTQAKVNGEELLLDSAVKLISMEGSSNAKTMVPIRFIVESLGYDVAWDQVEQAIIITKADDVIISEDQEEPVVSIIEESKEVHLQLKNLEERIPFIEYKDSVDNEFTTLERIRYYKYHDRYTVLSEEAMSSIHGFVRDNQLIIDIDNSQIGHIQSEVDIYSNDYVTAVRSSQYSLEPMTTRVVFDLIDEEAPTSFVVSEDRTSIDVIFGSDGLSAIDFEKTEYGDAIEIIGDIGDLNIFRLSNPDRIVMDLENTMNPFGYNEFRDYDGNLIDAVRIGLFNETTTRIVMETDDKLDYSVLEQEGGELRVEFTRKSDQGETETYIAAGMISGMQAQAIEAYTTYYDHMTKSVTIDFGRSHKVSEKNIRVFDESIMKEVEVGEHTITIKSDHIYEVELVMYEGIFRIMMIRPKDLYEHIVVFDPGHGGKAPGAGKVPLLEKDVNLKIGRYIEELAVNRREIGYFYTRMVDKTVSLEERAEIANDLQATLFVSLHNNSLDVKKYPSQKAIAGLEVHVTETTEQSEAEKNLGEMILAGLERDITGLLAKRVKIFNELYVLKNTYMTSILVEFGYLSNQSDALFLSNDENLRLLAQMTLESVDEFILGESIESIESSD